MLQHGKRYKSTINIQTVRSKKYKRIELVCVCFFFFDKFMSEFVGQSVRDKLCINHTDNHTIREILTQK